MNIRFLAAALLAAFGSVAIAQNAGSSTGAGAGATPSGTTPATRASPATPAMPRSQGDGAIPATPATPATPADPGLSGGRSNPEMESARKACARLSGEEARQACVRQHSRTGSGSMQERSEPGGAGRSHRGSDTSVSPGAGSGGGEDGRSKGGAGFPKGTTPNTDGGAVSGGRSGSGKGD